MLRWIAKKEEKGEEMRRGWGRKAKAKKIKSEDEWKGDKIGLLKLKKARFEKKEEIEIDRPGQRSKLTDKEKETKSKANWKETKEDDCASFVDRSYQKKSEWRDWWEKEDETKWMEISTMNGTIEWGQVTTDAMTEVNEDARFGGRNRKHCVRIGRRNGADDWNGVVMELVIEGW